MATKAELEANARAHDRLLAKLNQAEGEQDYRQAIRVGVECLPLQRELLQYMRRYEKEAIPNLPGITAILKYAPGLFDRPALMAAKEWIDARNKNEKTDFPQLPQQFSLAWEMFDEAVSLWSVAQGTLEGVSVPKTNHAKRLVDLWINAGLAMPLPGGTFTLITHPKRMVKAKCSFCGELAMLPLRRCLDNLSCEKCLRSIQFKMISRIV